MVAVASFVLPVLPFLAVVAAGLVETVEVEGFVGHIGNSSRSNIGGQGRSNQIPAAFIVFIARNLLGERFRKIPPPFRSPVDAGVFLVSVEQVVVSAHAADQRGAAREHIV